MILVKISNKGILIILISIVVVLIIAVFIVMSPIIYGIEFLIWDYVPCYFEEYREDYEIVAKYCIEFFVEQDINFDETNYVSYGHKKLYYEGEKFQLPEDVQKSFSNLGKAFNESDIDLYDVYYEKNRLSFHIEGEPYAIVYSFYGNKPTYWSSPGDGGVLVKKIDRHWYYIKKRR